jgi:hypothetical protein
MTRRSDYIDSDLGEFRSFSAGIWRWEGSSAQSPLIVNIAGTRSHPDAILLSRLKGILSRIGDLTSSAIGYVRSNAESKPLPNLRLSGINLMAAAAANSFALEFTMDDTSGEPIEVYFDGEGVQEAFYKGLRLDEAISLRIL